MLKIIVMIEGQDGEANALNKSDLHLNRGVELLLRNRRREEPPKTFQVRFGNMVSLFRRDFVFHFNFYLDIRKR